jgi:CubicO group peptidase (beta-lactamase class C family)
MRRLVLLFVFASACRGSHAPAAADSGFDFPPLPDAARRGDAGSRKDATGGPIDAGPDPDAFRPAQITSCQATAGSPSTAYQAVEDAVLSFMTTQAAHNATLAISKGGSTVLSRAYTCPGALGVTSTRTMFRLASNSKAWTSAAIDLLVEEGTVSRSTPAFAYLGIMTPLPSGATVDPRVASITVGNLIDHKSGWDDTVSPDFDPTHSMRQIALALGLTDAIDETQMVQYMLGQPLQEAPGTTYAYCNFCYDVLGMIVEKASGTSLVDYLDQKVAAPLGVTDLVVSPTLEPRLPGEVAHYDSPNQGLSAVDVTSSSLVPAPNGGDGLVREVDVGAGGLATSAASMLALMQRYVIWGVGPRPARGSSWSREGSDEGTNTWAEQRADGTNWALLFNTRDFTPSTAFTDLTTQLDQILGTVP